ncbi:pyridoxamine 5'-phosphate oxidase family protein [Mucilaginibacter terrenus]|uniref:Pyridoxamine 5'-phosphate oxidase family protein n=1 Tax=Mucilaginibacter terrenus TaxID=2482727 RepID=A0A3E2NWR6_9SPHI|nr:pyridoxamine 5'-phosphate oxidase family protein [Mucilaginibacter terrenus]RFZ85300.1 pyridoxamine 5'-phosphate oxidase family protein [Mucilaginibacter terrenus]
MNYSKIAFSDAVKELQHQFGSRQAYDRREKFQVVDGLTENEIDFIADQDHFYMASIGESGFPYIQHRGGPKGFVKVLDDHTVAFVDFSGNKQYITVGNLETNAKVSLIMVSYAHKARLKLYATAKIVLPDEDPKLFSRVDVSNYKHHAERIIILDVAAYDWNCPQHITPRYTTEEIEHAFEPQRQYIAQLEAKNKKLEFELKNYQKD